MALSRARLNSSSETPAGTGKRMAVTSPNRLPHILCPAASVMNALGVPRWSFQYASSFGRIRFRSTAKPASQSRVLSAFSMPGKSGISVRSA